MPVLSLRCVSAEKELAAAHKEAVPHIRTATEPRVDIMVAAERGHFVK